MAGSVAEWMICLTHDCRRHLEIKNFLTKKSGVVLETKKKIKIYSENTD